MGTCCEKRESVPELFGSHVFNDNVMQERLPKDVYKSLRQTIDEGKDLDLGVANAVANAMKDWAVEQGATHFTHWFQPLNGVTNTRSSVISPTSDGRVIMQFSGKELVKGEPDASSFPSGGLRAPLKPEATLPGTPPAMPLSRGIPFTFQRLSVLQRGSAGQENASFALYGSPFRSGAAGVADLWGQQIETSGHHRGAEQEYFLVDKKLYDQRPDLLFTGRTLFGAKAPRARNWKTTILGPSARVAAFMKELDEELWKLGILAKTKHNEVAPAPARAGAHFYHHQRGNGPQPAHHGSDEERGCPPWPGVLAP